MKAISLWQPWASSMMRGLKSIETRSWPTSYRGQLLICSAKRKPTLEECGDEETYQFSLTEPYGYALILVDLIDCIPTDYFQVTKPNQPFYLSQTEAELGNYSKGRWGWITDNPRQLKRPMPIIGRQGLWNINPEMQLDINALL